MTFESYVFRVYLEINLLLFAYYTRMLENSADFPIASYIFSSFEAKIRYIHSKASFNSGSECYRFYLGVLSHSIL